MLKVRAQEPEIEGWSDIAPAPEKSRSWPKLLLVMALVGLGLRYLVLIGSST